MFNSKSDIKNFCAELNHFFSYLKMSPFYQKVAITPLSTQSNIVKI